MEVRLEDRLDHQLQRGLHDPIDGSRDPQSADLARCLWDRLLPHATRGEPSGLEIILQPSEELPSLDANGSWNDAVDARGSCALVAPDPAPRDYEERRVTYKVVEVIKAAVRIGRRPVVQLHLHCEYPGLGLIKVGQRSASVHQRSPPSALML